MSDDNSFEKGFNEDELADIMNEIESLEDEFEEASEPSVEEEPEVVAAAPEVIAQEEPEEEDSEDYVDDIIAEEVFEEPFVSDPVEVVHAEKTEEVKEVIAELSEMPVEQSVPGVEEVVEETNVHQFSSPAPTSVSNGSPAHTAMSFQVEGEMKLSMSFMVSGKQFDVCVDEEDGFVITLDGGAQFKVPIHTNKKVA
ncbi:MAG: hypothetical protein ACI9QD_001135 [Thermoproteota archaeon]|jgi:hypothetical protein